MAIECPKCHTENPDESRFCNSCAASLTPIEDISVLPTQSLGSDTDELTRGTVFAGRYQVIEELGKGGMGRVFRVEDTKVNEEVALKVLKPEIASDKKTIDRFQNELKLARKVTHKYVCRMFDLNQENSTHYITMEYVPGENLKSMLKMTKQLSIGTAVNIAKQICEGLNEAHILGVVHRDLKPSNIMIDKAGDVRIMDFGIARSLQAKGITAAGILVGTPEYISPEQVEGKCADKRSDLYSLGVILYEMVTGRSPFDGDTPLSIAVKHKTEIPQDPWKFNSDIPESLSRVILKCMEKDIEKRYQNAGELFADLNRIEEGITTRERAIPRRKPIGPKERRRTFWKSWKSVFALFTAAILVGLVIIFIGKDSPPLAPARTMIVVLPFENLGPPEDAYFADGITEEVTSRLAALQGLGVISRTSAVRYKDTDKTIRKIGEELNVDYVLEGAVRWNRNGDGLGRVRVTPKLIRVSDDTQVWSESYDRIIQDLFSVQSGIAEQVARQLDITVLEPERQSLYAQPTDNLEAYDLYLQGIEHGDQGWRSSDANEFEQAIQMFERAIELDPDFALAYVEIANAHLRMYFFGADNTEERLAKARAFAERALELQPDLPEALEAMALYNYWGFLDYDRAVEIIETIQRARPNLVPNILGYIKRRQGKWEEAVETMIKSFELDPRYSQLAYEVGSAYLSMRQYEKAKEWFDRTLSINPDHLAAQLGKAQLCILSEGDVEKARSFLENVPQHPLTDFMWFTIGMIERNYQGVLDRLDSLSYSLFEEQHIYFHRDLAYAAVYHAMGDASKTEIHAGWVRTALERTIAEHPSDPRYHAALGLTYAYLGQKDEAIRAGERAVDIYPVSKDAALGPIYLMNLARICTLVGEHEKAMEQLESLKSIYSAEFLWQVISVPLLQIDPQWDPLRDYPRFQQLLQEDLRVAVPE
jgi:TolB-like protein/Tfp pilus assembly protein PilF/predicted Ser/Thr protein kinase